MLFQPKQFYDTNKAGSGIKDHSTELTIIFYFSNVAGKNSHKHKAYDNHSHNHFHVRNKKEFLGDFGNA